MTSFSSNLISQILKGVWYLHGETPNTYLPLLERVLNNNFAPQHLIDKEIFTTHIALENNHPPTHTAEQQRATKIVAIQIQGILVKYADCALGTMDIAQLINKYAQDDTIKGIILKIDSQGGMLDGLNTVVNSISNARKKKPIFAFIEDGSCCSGGYYIAAACQKIYCSKDTDTVGSIGVMITLTDLRGYYKKTGIVQHNIYAQQSSEKNSLFQKALTGDYEPLQKEVLDIYAEEFVNHVKTYRNIDTTQSNPFKGATYYAYEAIKIGLIDKIGSLKDVIKEIENASTNKGIVTHHYYSV